MNRYLVYLSYDGERPDPNVMTAMEVFNLMDMSDCSGARIVSLFLLEPPNDPVPCAFLGKWCCDDPLCMKIVGPDGDVLDEGYGTDH